MVKLCLAKNIIFHTLSFHRGSVVFTVVACHGKDANHTTLSMAFITQWFWKRRVRGKIHFQEEPSDSNSVHNIKNRFPGIVYSSFYEFEEVEDIFAVQS